MRGQRNFGPRKGRAFKPRRTDALNSKVLKNVGAICAGAQDPPFQNALQGFLHQPPGAGVIVRSVNSLPDGYSLVLALSAFLVAGNLATLAGSKAFASPPPALRSWERPGAHRNLSRPSREVCVLGSYGSFASLKTCAIRISLQHLNGQETTATPSIHDLMASLEQALARGQRVEGGRILRALLERPHLDADTLIKAGVLFAQQDSYDDAAQAFARCARDYPKVFEGYYNLALVDFALQKYPEALAALEGAASSPQQEVARQYLRGKIEAALGWTRQAQSDLEAAFTKAPYEENYALDLGLFYLRHQLYAKAGEVFEKASQANPSSPYLGLGLSLTLFQLGNYARCIATCRHLLQLQPDFSPAWLMLAFALGLDGKWEEAEKTAAQGLSAPNPHPYLYYLHVSLLLKLHSTDYDRQLGELAIAEQAIPECSLCGLAESKIYQAQGNIPQAIADLEKALKLDPNFSEAWYRLALLYERAGRLQDAELARARHNQLKTQEADREAETLRQVFMESLAGQESQRPPR